MNNRSTWKVRGLLALLVSLPASFAVAQTAPAAAENEEEVKLEAFSVTGSRIKRLDVEGPQPVIEFSRDDILNTGYNNLGDFIQTLPFNSGSVNYITEAASFTRGAQTANLRGLGGSRFLTLINGRRVTSFALADGNQRSVFDFGSIPASAIESVEFLKDGASAIYGSDAITGVLDIKLRKDFVGLNVTAQYGNTLGHDSGAWTVSATFGAASGKTSILGTFSWSESNANYIRDYDRSKTVDYSASGRGRNNRSTFMFPANLNLSADQATAAGLTGGRGFYTVSSPTATPTVASFVPIFRTVLEDFATFEFSKVYQLFPETRRYGFYTRMEHEINDNLRAIGEVNYSNTLIPFDFTPAVVNAAGTPGTAANGTLRISANNPYNPLGFDITGFRYRTSFLPNRGFNIDSDTARLVAALEGDIGFDWNWQAAVVYSSSKVSEVSTNAIRASDLQRALDGTTLATALNPFGPSNQAVLDSLATTSQAYSAAETTSFDFSVSGLVFDLPAGGVGVAFGGETRRESLRDNPDTAPYVGSGGGSPFDGSRNVNSVFAEVVVPVLPKLEFQFAARYEDYSDFGDTTKPKAAVAFSPTSWVKLRASYSEAFKAPDLAQLFSASQTSFTSQLIRDPLRPTDPPQQVRQISGGNPNLQPEEATVVYGGVVVDFDGLDRLPEWVQGFSFSADYFEIRVEDVISTPGATTIFSRPLVFPDQQFVRRDNTGGYPGPIIAVLVTPANVSEQRWEGWDFGVDYTINTTNLGRFNAGLDVTYTHLIGLASSVGGFFENTGLYNNPRLTGALSLGWSRNDWAVNVFTSYVGPYFNDGYTAAGWKEGAHATINPSVSYRGLWDTKITVGANNVLDRDPPFNGYDLEGYDTGTYSGLGRFVYVRLEKDF